MGYIIMNSLRRLKIHKQIGYFAALLFMTLPAAGLFLAANNADVLWIWVLVSLIVIGNLIALLLK